jgi:hypothetical protein
VAYISVELFSSARRENVGQSFFCAMPTTWRIDKQLESSKFLRPHFYFRPGIQ